MKPHLPRNMTTLAHQRPLGLGTALLAALLLGWSSAAVFPIVC